MTLIFHIAWKELRSYFAGWMAYATLAGWAFLGGYNFCFGVLARPQAFSLVPLFYTLTVILLFLSPILTMRLLAEEKREGTLEMLFTSPLTEWQVTLGKWLAAWAFVGLMIVLTLPFEGFAFRYGSLDSGPVWGGLLALICCGAAFSAFGLFCSSLTDNQSVAGFLTFGGLLISWFLSFAPQAAPENAVAGFVAQWSVFSHLTPMLQGAIDTRDLVFFASFTILFLFATVRVLESRKWRA